MSKTANQNYPLRHISVRVPWHDDEWRGTVCKAPKLNGACLRLPRIAESRNDDAEQTVAGKSIENLDQSKWPCCISDVPCLWPRLSIQGWLITLIQKHHLILIVISPKLHCDILFTQHRLFHSCGCVLRIWNFIVIGMELM